MFYFLDLLLGKLSKFFLLALIMVLSFFAYQAKELQLDASSDTLILEDDEDLKKARKVSRIYESKDFLIITLTDEEGIISKHNLSFINKLIIQINELEWVESTQSILDAPLLTVNEQSLSDLANEVITISQVTNLEEAEKELRSSPIFKNLIISNDGTTSAILINLNENNRLNELVAIRNLDATKFDKNIENEYQKLKTESDFLRHQNIIEIRQLIENNERSNLKMYLGGIPMIADDTITFVKNDIFIFGFGVLLFIIFVLFIIFKNISWILIALANCFFSLISMVGIVAFLEWKITVISSNFISLMLILTLSMTVHIVVRYKQLLIENLDIDKIEVIKICFSKMLGPCIFTTLTTVFAFATLYTSGIKPVMDFGLMMCIGLTITFITSFTLLPIVLNSVSLPLDKTAGILTQRNTYEKIIIKYPKIVIFLFFSLFVFGVYGSSLLKVENSFVDYFKKDTEIYKGMKLIDQNLGGTTPLDVVIQFNDAVEYDDEEEDDFLDFGIEYDPADYWFTKEKIDLIKNVHDHLESYQFSGKILSLASLVRTAEQLNENEEFDSLELAVLYKKLPQELKEQILSPYLSIENNQARISMRIIDTHKDLRRNEFIENLNNKINQDYKSDGYLISVSGILILYNNMLQSLFDSQIKSLAFVMLGIFIMLAVLFRSIKIALATIIPNIIACFTVLGTMGLIGIPLDLMTITIAAITVGIAVDNCIHYVYRFREYYTQNKDYEQTVTLCKNTVARAIKNTSLTIIVGFSILIFSNFYPTIYFGIFTALAMLVALLGSLTLLPILLKFIKY